MNFVLGITSPRSPGAGGPVSEDRHTDAGWHQALPCKLPAFPLLIPISPSAHPKAFCLFTSPSGPCSPSCSEAPFSPVLAQAAAFVSSAVTLTTMLRGDLETDLHLYVRHVY